MIDMPDVSVSVTPQDFATLAQSDPDVRMKAINVALNRTLVENNAKFLGILKQIKSGELPLERLVVSDIDWDIMPAPPKEKINNTSEEKVPAKV